MSEFRFKGKNTILIPMAIVVLVMTIPFFVMSVKGLLNMDPDDNKTLQIVGVAVTGALVPIALVNLVHALIFRVVVLWHKYTSPYLCIEPWCGIQDVAGSSPVLSNKEGIHAVNPGCHFARTHTITVG